MMAGFLNLCLDHSLDLCLDHFLDLCLDLFLNLDRVFLNLCQYHIPNQVDPVNLFLDSLGLVSKLWISGSETASNYGFRVWKWSPNYGLRVWERPPTADGWARLGFDYRSRFQRLRHVVRRLRYVVICEIGSILT